jgi:HK97 family phage portal protein
MQSWVYICIERNAVAVMQQILRMYRRDSKTPRTTKSLTRKQREHVKATMPMEITPDTVEAEDHPFLQLLEKPNPILDRSGLFWLTIAYLQLCGHAYWHMYFSDDGQPIELWPLPAQFVTPRFGSDMILDTYEFRMGGKVQYFTKEEIVHFRKPSPIDTISGFGNLRGMLETSETDIRMMEYERAVFDNMATPDIIISAKGDTSPQQVRQLEAQWRQDYAGHRRRGKAAAIPFPIDIQQLSFKNRDLEFDKGKIQVRDKLAAGFGVPIPILTSTSTTFSNMDVGVQLWMRNTIQPILVHLSSTLNTDVMPLYSPVQEDLDEDALPERTPWFVCFDNPVPEDVDAMTIRDKEDVGAGIRCINEVRRERNLEEVAWGDEPLVNMALRTPTQIEEQIAFDQEQALMLTQAQIAAVEAGATNEGPGVSFSELTTALQQCADMNDIEGVNLVRARMAEHLGGSVMPIEEITPAPSGAIVNPDDAADRPQLTEEVSNGTAQGQQEQENAGEGKGGMGSPDERRGSAGREDPEGGGGIDKGSDDREPSTEEGVDGRPGPSRFDKLGWARQAQEYYATKLETLDEDERDKTLDAVLIALFNELESEVVEHLAAADKWARPRVKTLPDKIGSLLDILFDKAAWIKRFAEGAFPSLLQAFKKGEELGSHELEQAGVVIGRLSSARIEKHVQELAQTFASTVVDMTGRELADALLPGIREGENIGQLSQRVGEVFGDKKSKHAELIARTEVNSAMNAGASDSWQEAGIEKQEWLASGDACEFCLALNGKVVEIGEPFAKLGTSVKGVNGGSYAVTYKNIMYPTLHPNCTCAVVPVVE